jgi:hypothetical protein
LEVNLLPQLKVNILTILHLSMVGFTQAARSTQEDIDLALDAARLFRLGAQLQ